MASRPPDGLDVLAPAPYAARPPAVGLASRPSLAVVRRPTVKAAVTVAALGLPRLADVAVPSPFGAVT